MADDQDQNPGKEAVAEGQHPVTLRVMHANSSVDHQANLDFGTPIKFLKAEVDADINHQGLDSQEWRFGGNVLEEGKTIGDYRIRPGNVIEVKLA